MNTIEEFFKNRILFNEVNRTYRCIDYISNVFKPEVFNYIFFFKNAAFCNYMFSEIKINENRSVSHFNICFCQENRENMHNVFHLKLDYTIEPKNFFFSLFNSKLIVK